MVVAGVVWCGSVCVGGGLGVFFLVTQYMYRYGIPLMISCAHSNDSRHDHN